MSDQVITLPHHFESRWYQENFIYQWEHKKRLMLIAHRRAGKDKMVFANLPAKMLQRVGTYFYFLPTYNQARKVIWNGSDKDGFKFLDHFPRGIVKSINQTEMTITLTNGSILQMVGADNIDRIVGTNPVGCVFSEYALMKKEVWDLISPILLENGGWAVFIFTPRGKNHAHDLLQKAQKDPNWLVEILPVSKTKALSDEQIAEAKMNMTDALFRQEYECEFEDNVGAVYRNVKSRTYPMHSWTENPNGIYQIGVDLAKSADYTVITPFDITTFRVAPQDSFNQIDYTLQKTKIEAAYHRFGRGRVIMDATGVGVPIVDDLLNKGINVAPFTFSYNSRNELLVNLQILLEQGKVQIPDDPELVEELESAYWDTTASGRSKIIVPDGKHDDRLMSLALAVWDIPTRPVTAMSQQRVIEAGGIQPFYPDIGY